jgi:riboflavin biosynthesis pyrimidine reductase
MRAWLPAVLDDVDVHVHYAADWLSPGGLRANFVASVDGAVAAEGRSAGLQTPGDNRVFAVLRDLADVVLVGSGTALAERYGAVRITARREALRRELGLRPVLPLAVISRNLALDPDSALFADAAPDARTIVVTCARAPADRRQTLERVAEVLVCGEDSVDLAETRAALEARGLTRILSEGGPRAFADLVAAGVADELCLSLTPYLVGPGPGRIVAGAAPWPATSGLALTGLLEEDGALFLRYRIPGSYRIPGTMSSRS